MEKLRGIIVCLVVLCLVGSALAMSAAPMNAGTVAGCHHIDDDVDMMPATGLRCSGMACCGLSAPTTLSIAPRMRTLDLAFYLPLRELPLEAELTHPDKPPRIG